MDVNFLLDVEPVNPDVLLQQMADYQNGLMTEHYNEQNEIIVRMRSRLQDYLDRNHPGLVVPSNGPHFQVVMNSLENIALLTLEAKEIKEKHQQYDKAANEVFLKMSGIDNYVKTVVVVNSSLKTLEELGAMLDHVRDWVSVMTQTRLDSEGLSRRLILRHSKIRNLAKQTNAATTGEGEEGDFFLGILRKGMLSSFRLNDELHEQISEELNSSLEKWSRFKAKEEAVLKAIDAVMEILKPT